MYRRQYQSVNGLISLEMHQAALLKGWKSVVIPNLGDPRPGGPKSIRLGVVGPPRMLSSMTEVDRMLVKGEGECKCV